MKTFSTKLDPKVLYLLDIFCKRYHLKKSHVLAEIIEEGVRRRAEAFELARSIRAGLEQEEKGELFRLDEVERSVFGKKNAG